MILLPRIQCYRKLGRQSRGRRHQQDGQTGIAGDDPRPLPSFIEPVESRILDEFIAVTGHHRKHGIRLLGQFGNDWEQQPAAKKGRRSYDEAVRQALFRGLGSC